MTSSIWPSPFLIRSSLKIKWIHLNRIWLFYCQFSPFMPLIVKFNYIFHSKNIHFSLFLIEKIQDLIRRQKFIKIFLNLFKELLQENQKLQPIDFEMANYIFQILAKLTFHNSFLNFFNFLSFFLFLFIFREKSRLFCQKKWAWIHQEHLGFIKGFKSYPGWNLYFGELLR